MAGKFASVLRPEGSLFFIAVLRVAVGLMLVWQGYDKIQQSYLVRTSPGQETTRVNPLGLTLDMWIDEARPVYSHDDGARTARTVRMFSWYRTFLERAVRPHAQTFAMLITIAELAIGGLLILGLLTRVAAVFGVLLILNYLFATWHYGITYQTLNLMFLVSLTVFLLAAPGRSVGLDAVLHERYPEIPLF